MRKSGLIALVMIILFLLPASNSMNLPFANGPESSFSEELQGDSPFGTLASGPYTGTGPSLTATMSGVATNSYDGAFVIDSSNPAIGTITLSDGWDGSNLQATIDSLSIDVTDALRNPTWDIYHEERWLVGSSDNWDEDVAVPDGWTLVKNEADEDAHPHHGDWELNDGTGGYGGSRGFRFETYVDSSSDPSDEIYLSQMVNAPYRALYSAEIKFRYYVISGYNITDQIHLFVRFAGVERKFNVFASGEPIGSWQQKTIALTLADLQDVSLPDALLLDVGMATDSSGLYPTMQVRSYIDEIELTMNVRPYPEQIDLKVNGTAVVGSTLDSIYPWLPDDSNRDAYDDNSNGVDLDGWPWGSSDGDLSVGVWSLGTWSSAYSFEIGLQFPMNIPQGAAITAAYVEVEPTATYGGGSDMRILVAGEDTGGSPISNFTTGLPHLEDRYAWVDTSIEWFDGTWDISYPLRQRSPDIAPLIQKVVSDSNWNYTDYVCIMLDYMYSAAHQAYLEVKGSATTNNWPANELSRLYVEYLIPEEEDTTYLFQYKKDITIDHTQVAGDLADFPVLVNIYDSDLRTDVQSDGDDIAFRMGDQALDYEIEFFDQTANATHAHLVAWVKVPTLSSTQDTVITMVYGNPDVPSGSSSSIWSDYETVHHLNNDPSGIQYDSTSNNYDGTTYGTMGSEDLVTGPIDGALDFDDSTFDAISIGQIDTDDWTQFTMSTWVYHGEAEDDRAFSKTESTTPTNHIMTLRITSSGLTVRLRTDGASGAGSSYDSSNTTIAIGKWQYVVWSWSALTGRVVAYVNGSAAIDVPHGGSTLYDSQAMFVIGSNSLAGGSEDRFWTGMIDEARITKMVLTEEWIDTEFNNQLNPDSFISIGSEQALQSAWSDDDSAQMVFSTTSTTPVDIFPIMTMDISGGGQTLDENLNDGTTYYAANSSVVEWTANVLVSPPADTSTLDVRVDYPFTEWNPISVKNPLRQSKVYGTDWEFHDGYVIIYGRAVDYWGVWEFKFNSWNYAYDLKLGPSGDSTYETYTFNISDDAEFKVSTPWVEGAGIGLVLTDPTGSTWHTDSATTGIPGSAWHMPSYAYRMQLQIPAAQVDADVTNYPMLVNFEDSDFMNGVKVQTDGDDFVFVDDGNVLAHEIERFESSTGRLVAWVRVNLSSTVDNYIWLYYGNPVVGSTESPYTVWSNGYDAVWHLGESSGDHFDSAQNNYTGVRNGNTMTSGIANTQAQDFDGNDWISINATEGLDPAGDITVSGWFYLLDGWDSSETTSQIIMSKYLTDEDNFHIAMVGTDYLESGVPFGSLVLGFETEVPGEFVKWTTTTFWLAGWYHFSCLIDVDTPTNNKIYINGIDRTNAGSVGGASSVSLAWNADWGIGGRYGETSEFPTGESFFVGKIDEVRIASTIRAGSWIGVEYDNIFSFEAFVQEGSEQTRTSPEHTFNKILDASAPAGVWTVSIHYNDTGSTVTNKTGLYERDFVVKHDTTLTLFNPSDAVSDKTAYKVAGEILYVEVELTDDANSDKISDATVEMNWSVSGVPTLLSLNDIGNGRYGKSVNTSDLGTAGAYHIELESSHPYMNNATDYFTLELYHATELDYTDVDTTPIGYQLTATLVFTDTYDGIPLTGATITFANGTPVNVVAEGGGRYNISLSSVGLSYGDHWYVFRASTGNYMEDGTVNVTFTLRKHFTTVSVTGSLTTPEGEFTYLTVVIVDTDTGGTLSTTADVSSWSFTSSYSPFNENNPSDFDVALTTTTWDLGSDTVALTVTMGGIYYSPSVYQFDVTIREHYTTVSVIGDLLTPSGVNTSATLVILDLDTGAELTATSVTSYLFSWSGGSHNVNPALSLTTDIPTSGWLVGSTTVTLLVSMGTGYENPTAYQFDIQIRNHYTTASVTGDLTTPFGSGTLVTVIITDSDTGSILTASEVASYLFTWSGGSHSVDPASSLSTTIPSGSWPVGSRTVTLTVIMSGDYDAPLSYQFDIQIRNHYTSANVAGGFLTPAGADTTVTVVITDLDTATSLTASEVASYLFTWSGGSHSVDPASSLTTDLPTSGWPVGVRTVTLTVVMSGDYDNPSSFQFEVEIRNHYTSVSISGDLTTPYESTTDVTIIITDLDTDSELVLGDVASYSFTWSGGSYTENPATTLTPTLPTNTWIVGTVTVNLTLVLSGDFENPNLHQFNIVIRNHYTAVTVVGSLTSPFGNATSVTVQVIDLDTGLQVNIANVSAFDFTWVGGSYNTAASSYDVTLPTDNWVIGSKSVTIDVTMDGGSYFDDPDSYIFIVTIRSLATYLFNEPSNLIIPTGFDFTIIVRLNITEPGQYYGEFIDGQAAAISVLSYPSTIIALGNGRYNVSVDASFFSEGTYSLTILYLPTNTTLTSTQLVIVFDVRPTRSDLTSNLYTISTPYNMNFTVVLYYEDLDRSTGIPSATITSPDTWISFSPLGGGSYQVTVGVVGFGLGIHQVNLTADAAGYDPRSVIITVVITQIHTDAEPSTISLDMPVGSSRIFYIDYNDLDNSVNIDGATVDHNWTGVIPLDISWTGTQYRINMTTTGSDALGNLIIWFNLTKGAEYQPGYCEIEVVLRSHITIFNLVSAVEPTAYNGKINISVRYYDWDDKIGIDSALVQQYVWNQTHWIASTLINEGSGFYTVQIDALLFGLGLQTFTIYFNWTGPVEQYENKTLIATANLVGVDSKLTLLISSEPTPFLGNMTYNILYSELSSGIGINNDSSNVFIYVTFQGETVDLNLVDVWEIDPVGNAGEYTIQFNTSIFSHTGLIYMNLYINWSKGVAPYYTNRTDTISVRLLPRDSLISIIPASATPYNENATFSFTFEDVTEAGGGSIADSPSLTITLSLADYTLYYYPNNRTFKVSFDTSQFGAPLGQKSFTLDVVWVGAPFYANRTGQVVFVTVSARQTILDYQAPAPTSFGDNVTFSVIWIDITSLPSAGITSATVTLYDGASPIPAIYYTIVEQLGGEYEIEFDSSYYSSPGNYDIKANITSTDFFYLSEESTRVFNLRYRVTLLSAEPINKVPFNSSIVAILYYQDLLTLANIGNGTSDVTLEIIPAGTWIFTCVWQPANGYYVLTIETYNQVGLSIGVEYSLTLNISYADQDPYYRYDDLVINFELRYRASSLERTVSPVPTAYLEYTNFTVYYSDADSLAGIVGGSIHVFKSGTELILGTQYLYTSLGEGLYTVSVLTTALDGIGVTSIQVQGNWTAGSPYHNNATLNIYLTVIRRTTNVEIVVPPAQTRFLENASFVVAFLDLGTGQSVAVTKNIIHVFYGATQLLPSEFSITQQGATLNYEISIDSEFLSATLVTNLNVTIFVDWPDSPDYYKDDASSTRVTIVARDTFLSIERPANTAYGENATFTFQFLDVTSLPEIAISDSPELTIITNLTETPTIIAGVGIFTISFDTAQFGTTGLIAFYLNVTWAGAPYYSNKTLQNAYVTVIIRQTQLDFEAPEPTPYGDYVNFTVTYLDIAGASEVGIPDGWLTLYYGGSPIPFVNYDITPDGSGSFEITFYSGFFAEPGLYVINATVVYTGSEFKSDATAARTLNVRFRSTLLSSEPVGKIGYATPIEVALYFQDMLTLQNIANASSTFLSIVNDTGTPWDFTIQWRAGTEDYLLTVQTAGQPLNLNVNYTLHINMSYVYASPYYRWDDITIAFSLRTRSSSLDIQETPQPTPYLELINFTLYYWDVDVTSGISGASIDLYAPGPLTPGVHYFVTTGVPGVYYISVNSTVFGGLGSSWTISANAIWVGGAPFYKNASRLISPVVVTTRPTDVEIVSPPSATKYWNNVTFTFSFTDQISLQPITVTISDITLYSGGSLLSPSDFSMVQVGTNFEVSINSTVLGAGLVDRLNLTIVIDWNDLVAPFYKDDSTQLKVTTVERRLAVEPQQIEAVPMTDVIQENMTIILIVEDDDTGNPVIGAEIDFDCLNGSVILLEGVTHDIIEGTGVDAGTYTIIIRTEALGAIGNFLFSVEVKWNPLVAPFYFNKSAITLIGSVEPIWAIMQAGAPSPASVQISGQVSLVVSYLDNDHGQVGVPAGAAISVSYLDTGIVPQGLVITPLGSGQWNISFSTVDLPSIDVYVLKITASLYPYTSATVTPSITVVNIRTSLKPLESTVTLNWTEYAAIYVNYTNLLHNNLTPNAVITWSFGGYSGTFSPEVVPGWYRADINTTAFGDGTAVITIAANKLKFDTSIAVVTLVVLPLPSDIVAIDPPSRVNRGSPIPIEIRLIDLHNDENITYTYVKANGLYARFKNYPEKYYFTYNSLTKTWNGTVPGSATEGEEPGGYSIRIIADMINYQVASYQFQIDIDLTATHLEILNAGGATPTIQAYYSENITVEVKFTAPITGLNITNATVFFVFGFAINETFTHMGDGVYSLTFNTSRLSYGVWGLTFTGEPADRWYATNYTTLALIIDRIPTSVAVPEPLSIEWGWSGNLSFYFNDTQFLRGISNAKAEYTYGPSGTLNATDLGTGWYIAHIDTTTLISGETYTIKISFTKPNHVTAEGAVRLTVTERPTEVILDCPELNQIDENPLNLRIPMGDTIEVWFYYNDTSLIGGMYGGLANANISDTTKFAGPSFGGQRDILLEDMGDGYYRFVFDTMDTSLYFYSNGTPIVYSSAFFFTVGLDYPNRIGWEETIAIRVVNVETQLEAMDDTTFDLTNGVTFRFRIYFNDTWHNQAIENALITYPVDTGTPVVITGHGPESGSPGFYYLDIQAVAPSGDTVLTIQIGKLYHLNQTLTITVSSQENDFDIMMRNVTNYGLPLALVIIVLMGLYVRVWSVPKRLRQINSQIKTLRKGKIPKPIEDVSSRQKLLAELFNDTFADLEITRVAMQMPEESVAVAVPEMGELLIQLSILTNLSPDELEEFQADISKMRISEQAAFVREVIDQEAVRAARRDGKTPEQVIEETRFEALARLRGEDERVERVLLTEPEEKPMILMEEEEPKPKTFVEEEEATPDVDTPEDHIPVPGEKLSEFELGELRKELTAKGVPPHEIDTIMEQARVLPRDLVEELVRSLSGDRE